MCTHEHKSSSSALIIGAIGVVFGDIGTSPLYALKETFAGHHPMTVEPASILGVLSLIFWTIMALVTLKNVAIIMRADNRGEGGSLALLARVTELTKNSGATWFVTMPGIFAAALFYGDSMITPAISVLSAVEGLNVVAPGLKEYILPITAIVLTGLFWIQKHGTLIQGRLRSSGGFATYIRRAGVSRSGRCAIGPSAKAAQCPDSRRRAFFVARHA